MSGPSDLIYDVECRPNGICVAVGERLSAGVVRISADAGHSWRDVGLHDSAGAPIDLRVLAIQAPTDSVLIAGCDSSYVAISCDKGVSWKLVRAFDSGSVTSVHMLDRVNGVAFTDRHPWYAIARTQDGGESWQTVSLPATIRFADEERPVPDGRVVIASIARPSAGTVVAVFESHPHTCVLTTRDEGRSWSQQALGSDYLRIVRFADSLHGWIVGGPAQRLRGQALPAVLRTSDGGATWVKTLDGARMRDIAVRNANEILAVADEKRVYASSDGGIT